MVRRSGLRSKVECGEGPSSARLHWLPLSGERTGRQSHSAPPTVKVKRVRRPGQDVGTEEAPTSSQSVGSGGLKRPSVFCRWSGGCARPEERGWGSHLVQRPRTHPHTRIHPNDPPVDHRLSHLTFIPTHSHHPPHSRDTSTSSIMGSDDYQPPATDLITLTRHVLQEGFARHGRGAASGDLTILLSSLQTTW